jgi:hypothetical protein
VPVIVLFAHAEDFAKHSFPLWLSTLQHDHRDAMTAGPTASLPQEDFPEFLKWQVVYGI